MDKIINEYIPIAKSLLIIAMAALSVVLTARLWLMYIPNHNFIPYVRARFASTVPDEVSALVRPFRIVQGSGDGYFSMLYSGIGGSEEWRYGTAVITSVLQSGSFIGRTETDLSHILDRPVLIYQYAFDMNAATFARAFGQRTGAALTDNGMSYFNAVAIHPLESVHDGPLSLFFIGENYMLEFSLLTIPRTIATGALVFDIPSAAYEIHKFVATANLEFVSRLTEPRYNHHPVLVTNPYLDHAGQLNLSHIRGQISHFFANPATINQGLNAVGVYTFNNLSTVVRYLPWDVIEYSSFRTITRSSPTTLLSDFSAAFAFVQNDPNVRNEFFLANYEYTVRGERIFWFNYTLGNFPLRLTENWYTGPDCETPLTHPIEVTVDNGRVIRYRRLVHNFTIDPRRSARVVAYEMGYGELSFPIKPRPDIGRHAALRTMR